MTNEELLNAYTDQIKLPKSINNIISGFSEAAVIMEKLDRCDELEKKLKSSTGWQPISAAPLDGTKILIYNPNWECAIIAHWGAYPCNPLCDSDGYDVYMEGWIVDDSGSSSISITDACEDGFLGWPEDIEEGVMPTYWMTRPEVIN